MKLRLFNTLGRRIEEFTPLNPPQVTLYTCGPTVYYYTHVGHVRAYTNSDVLRRTLEYMGFQVRHVMNVTDVGHMTSDQDAGEDKLEVGARREGKTPWEVARFYEDDFFRVIAEANILRPTVKSRATEHVDAQIELVKRLEERGFTYRTEVGVIFDTSKFPTYPDFAQLDLEGQQAGARVAVDDGRRTPQDFALWITNQPTHVMQWESPWGRGFPGWHLECSAMAQRYLGDTIDIHTGGIDHIPVHHTNEVAQSESATGKPFARFWFHTAFLNIDKAKMAKSAGNLFTLKDLTGKGVPPLALRYFYLGSSYRKPLNYTWEALLAADKTLSRLWERCASLPAPAAQPDASAIAAFEEAVGDDLNMPRALAAMWETLDAPPTPERSAALAQMDRILALDLGWARANLEDRRTLQKKAAAAPVPSSAASATSVDTSAPSSVTPSPEARAQALAQERQRLRSAKKFKEADEARQKVLALGFVIEDTPQGPRLKPTGAN